MLISDKLYTILKWISVICIPAIVTFLGVVLSVLDANPKTVNIIVTIIGAIGTLIGTLIGVSTSAYNKQKGEQNGENNSKPE